jgi:trimethylamine--corrinoid protein Co-methyltransferase
MLDLQLIIRGSDTELSSKPLTIFSCCPSSPLKWSLDTSKNILDCSRAFIPVELIAMPLSGFLAPVTLFDTIIQHTAETLSGIVISQYANPGSPLLYGGSPAIFDMRFQTTPMGAIETMMIICAYNQIGKSFHIPTQAYIALSDAKQLDMQAGIETGIGALLAVMSGINSISGPGMIDFESSFCIEKLIVDNEICRMAKRLKQGISDHDNGSFPDIFHELVSENHVLTSEHTQTYLRSEHLVPGVTINRKNRDKWLAEGEPTLIEHARNEVERMNDKSLNIVPDKTVKKALFERMYAEAKKYGMDKLPFKYESMQII